MITVVNLVRMRRISLGVCSRQAFQDLGRPIRFASHTVSIKQHPSALPSRESSQLMFGDIEATVLSVDTFTSQSPAPTAYPTFAPTLSPTVKTTPGPTGSPTAGDDGFVSAAFSDDGSYSYESYSYSYYASASQRRLDASLDELFAQRWLSAVSNAQSYSYDTDSFVLTSSSVMIARVPPAETNENASSADAFDAIDTSRRRLLADAKGGNTSTVPVQLTSNRMTGGEKLRIHRDASDKLDYVSISWSPGVFGVEERFWTSSNRGLQSFFYDPVARGLVSSLKTWYGDAVTQEEHIEFIATRGKSAGNGNVDEGSVAWSKTASASYVFVMMTSYYVTTHQYSNGMTAALEECGGSSMLNMLPEYDGDSHQFPYILVGQCGKGLGSGWSAARGLEIDGDEWANIDLEVDLAEYFEFGDGTSDDGGGTNYTYDPDLTTRVLSISRTNGTTAGGTTVQLNVTGLSRVKSISPSDVVVRLAGRVCATTTDEVGEYRSLNLCEWDGVDCSSIGIAETDRIDPASGEPVWLVTCVTNAWDYSGDAFEREVELYVDNWGDAEVDDGIQWSYCNLWSSATTWGGDLDNKPLSGDSVVITTGEFIILDEDPPPLYLLTIYGGTLKFAWWVGDIALNASYIFVFGGRMIVGTEDDPFPYTATITLEGGRNSYELPVYGAKCIAVRNALLDLHGLPSIAWTRLATTATRGNNTLQLLEPVDWHVGDYIFIASTTFTQYDTEEAYIAAIKNGGYTLELTRTLQYDHWGDGHVDLDTGVDMMPDMRAEVGRLTRNVILQGDDVSKREQFGVQVVLSSEGDESLIGRFSNVETRFTGQGLKLGKYPLHFHLVGAVTKSYITNCSVHHANNRAIAVHGITDLRVTHNVLLDIRGHAIFLEDGTEVRNTIAYNLVAVVRPVWSLLLVDQSPAAIWIVNPDNDCYGNAVAGSTHYGIWYRALKAPDGVSGQAQADGNIAQCPNFTPLGRFDGNVVHSVGRNGLKLSDYFPAVGGATCTTNTASIATKFEDFVAWKCGRFGIWGEFLVDVSFDNVRIVDHGVAGIEFLYMNGKGTHFATSYISNSLFIGETRGPPVSAAHGESCEGFQGNHNGNGCLHAIHLPGVGSELIIANVTFENYESAMYPGAWAIAVRGGYTAECSNITYRNVSRPITTKRGILPAGILMDLDGSLAGVPGGSVVPYSGQFDNNPDCTVINDAMYMYIGRPEYVVCKEPVRRITMEFKESSAYINMRSPLFRFPRLHIFDVTDYSPDVDARENGAIDSSTYVWGALGHFGIQVGVFGRCHMIARVEGWGMDASSAESRFRVRTMRDDVHCPPIPSPPLSQARGPRVHSADAGEGVSDVRSSGARVPHSHP